MTHPGSEYAVPDQPGTAAGATSAPQAEPEKSSNTKKWASVAGTVLVVGGGAVYSLTNGFGIGDPKVDACVQMQGQTSFEVVDCGSAEAEYKIVGIHDEELTYPDFEAAAAVDEVCQDFQTWEVALWIGDMETEPGTIYCSEPA
jgi:hypothetical protein